MPKVGLAGPDGSQCDATVKDGSRAGIIAMQADARSGATDADQGICGMKNLNVSRRRRLVDEGIAAQQLSNHRDDEVANIGDISRDLLKNP